MGSAKTSVALDSALVEEARHYGVNISRACASGLDRAVRAARQEAWRRENAAAMAEFNRIIAQDGIPLSHHRKF